MQGDELKAARKAMNLTQSELAEAIGMTATSVGLMERGAAPIEKRTALAIRHLFNERSRLYSNHTVEPLDDDVALINAMILWDRYGEVDPAVRIVDVTRGRDDQRYCSSFGACNAEWQQADDIGRLLRLFSRFVELTTFERIPAAIVHKAFSVIPEYRFAMSVGHFEEGVEGAGR